MLSPGYVALRKEIEVQRYSELLDKLERRIATRGIDTDDPALTTIAEILVRTGTLPAVAGVLADPDQPEPARMRALARAMRALRAADAAPVVPATAGSSREPFEVVRRRRRVRQPQHRWKRAS